MFGVCATLPEMVGRLWTCNGVSSSHRNKGNLALCFSTCLWLNIKTGEFMVVCFLFLHPGTQNTFILFLRKGCISKYLGIYTCKNAPYIDSSETVVHRAFYILHGSLWSFWLCSPPCFRWCFFISQQNHLRKPAKAAALSAFPPCWLLFPKAGVVWYGKTDPSPPASSNGKKWPGCWFLRSPQTTAQWGAGILCAPSHSFAAFPSCHSGFSCHFGVLGIFRSSVGTATTNICTVF